MFFYVGTQLVQHRKHITPQLSSVKVKNSDKRKFGRGVKHRKQLGTHVHSSFNQNFASAVTSTSEITKQRFITISVQLEEQNLSACIVPQWVKACSGRGHVFDFHIHIKTAFRTSGFVVSMNSVCVKLKVRPAKESALRKNNKIKERNVMLYSLKWILPIIASYSSQRM